MLSWKEIIQNYIIKHSNRIRKTTEPLREHFGVEYFSYHRIDNTGKYTVLVDRPDWAELYVREQMYLNDPYLRHPSVYRSGISLIESNGSEEYREMALKLAKENLDLDLGVTFIQKHDDYVDFFGFSGKRSKSLLEKVYLNQPQLLKSFAHHFLKQMEPILTKMEEEAGSLIDLKGGDFDCKDPIYPDISSTMLVDFCRDLGLNNEFEKLSPREKQCLKLLAENKTAKETAAALRLQPRTVEFYLENIKNKLGCHSKIELFQIAKTLTELGLLIL